MTINETLDNLERLAKGASASHEWVHASKRLVQALDGNFIAEVVVDDTAAFIAAASPATILLLTTAIREMENLWTWLAENPSLELAYCRDPDAEESSWQVHRVHGGYNDREWTLVAEAQTPLEAVKSARLALSTNGGKG